MCPAENSRLGSPWERWSRGSVTEIVFIVNRIGHSYERHKNVDSMLFMAITLLISMTVLLANFLIEIIYGLIDPRVRAAQAEES